MRLASYIAERYADEPLLLQHELADALSSQHSLDATLTISSPVDKYLDSREVLRQAKTYMISHGFDRAIIVAQARHTCRIEALCEKIGLSVTIPGDLPDTWDKRSAQWWVRSAYLWNIREPLVLLHHKVFRWT